MEITPENILALRTQVLTMFRMGYEETDVWYPRVAMTVPSSTSQNDYSWMAQLPSMEEWIGARTLRSLASHAYTIKNKRWELTFEIDRDDLDDDNLGTYVGIIEAHGEAARKHPDELMAALFNDGESTLCFDGQNFYDTDHPVAFYDSSKGTYSNYSASGMALTQDNFHIVRSTMINYKGDGGRSLKVLPDLLVIPPALEKEALEIVMAEKNASGASNVTFRMADVLMIPELTADDAWYHLVTRKRIKPYVFQSRRPLAVQAKLDPSNLVVLEQNAYRYYADARYNVGVTLPFLAYKAVA